MNDFASHLHWITCYKVSELNTQILQGRAVTDLRWGENFNKFLFRISLLNIAVKKIRKSVNMCQSYHKNKRVSFFMAHSVHSGPTDDRPTTDLSYGKIQMAISPRRIIKFTPCLVLWFWGRPSADQMALFPVWTNSISMYMYTPRPEKESGVFQA